MFNTDVVNSSSADYQPGRIALLVEAGIVVVVFCFLKWFSMTNKENELKVPDGVLWNFLWFIMVAAWTIGLVCTALDETSIVTVSLVGCFSLVALIACWWATSTYNNASQSDAAKCVILAAMMMSLCTIAAVTGNAPNDSLTMSSIFYAFAASTLGTAAVMSHAWVAPA